MPRPSHVRDAVQERLQRSDRHSWSVEEMLEDLRGAGVKADFSSVFRGLVYWEDEGLIQRIDVGDGKTHYERSGEHHEHARCEKCGTVAEVSGCLIDAAERQISSATGFRLTSHRLVFYGLCPNCQ